MGRPLHVDDLCEWKPRPGLGFARRLGQVLALEAHYALVQPMRRQRSAIVPQGEPLRVPLAQVRALLQRAIAVIQVASARPGQRTLPDQRPSLPDVAAPPSQPLIAAGTAPTAELPQLGPVIVFRTGPVPLRALPKPLPPVRSRAYLDFIRRQPCCSCRALRDETDQPETDHPESFIDEEDGPLSDPHHQGPRGMGQRADDLRTVPLCRACHDHYHARGSLPGRDRAETLVFILRVQVQLLVQFYGYPEGPR